MGKVNPDEVSDQEGVTRRLMLPDSCSESDAEELAGHGHSKEKMNECFHTYRQHTFHLIG